MFRIFNIKFINGDYKTAYKLLSNGGLMVAPSGPGLSNIDKEKKYYTALREADFAIPDSGLMVILSRLFFNIKIKKMSGPKFFRRFIKEEFLMEDNVLFSIDPNNVESTKNKKYLNSQGIPILDEYHYEAPKYNKENIVDFKLLEILENLKNKPKYILINLGGGIQERLGLFLKKRLSYKVGIICTGAAIAFETGSQAKIPKIIDEIYLGWLARIIQNPIQFSMRFLKAIRLVYVFYLCKINQLEI